MIYYNVNGSTHVCYKLTSYLLTTPKNIIACTKLHYNYVEVEFFWGWGGGKERLLHFININYISFTLPKLLHYHSLWPNYIWWNLPKNNLKRKIHPKRKGGNNKKGSKSNQQMAPKNANAQKRTTKPTKGRQHNNLCFTLFISCVK